MLDRFASRVQGKLAPQHSRNVVGEDENVTRPNVKVLKLPEPVCHIAAFLDSADLACFALVSKYLWALLRGQHRFADS